MSDCEPSTESSSRMHNIDSHLRHPVLWSLIVTWLFLWFLDRNARWPDNDQDTWWPWFYDDPMSFTGFLVLIIGLGYSVAVDRDQLKLIRYLYDSTIIDMNEEKWAQIKLELRRNSLKCQVILVLVVVILMGIGYSIFFSTGSSRYRFEFLAASAICSILAGLRLGRLVANGFTGRAIETIDPSFEVMIGHPDRTGGLARIGNFYFLQTLTLLLPIIWICFWLLILYMKSEYVDWQSYIDWWPHFWSLQIALTVLLTLCFLLPMRSFRRLMISWKKSNITPLLMSVRAELRALQKAHRYNTGKVQQLHQLANDLQLLTSLPNWPISPLVRTGFVSTLITLVISIASSWIVSWLAQ